jgi:site-specific recombinase XerD
MLVREAIADYLISTKRLQPGTQRFYRSRLDVFATWCENQTPVIHLEQIRAKTIDAFLEAMKATRKPHKANKVQISTQTLAGFVRAIRAFLRWCLDDEDYEEYVKFSTLRRIKLPVMDEYLIATFTDAHIEMLLRATAREYNEQLRMRDEVILEVLLGTGIRAAEIITLTIGKVELDAKDSYITIFGKGRKEREVGLPESVRRLLRRYMRKYRKYAERDEPVFLSRSGKQMTVGGLDMLIRRLGKWAGIQGVRCSPHTFRHTFASRLYLRTGDIKKVSLLMGHSSIRVTDLYLKSLSSRDVRYMPDEPK